MSNLPEPQSRNDEYLNYLCQRKLTPLVALNAVATNSLSQELNLTGANSIKFYVEIIGTGTVQIDILGACESGGVFIGNGVSKYFSASQSFMLPCTSDFIKVQVTVLSGTPTVKVRAQGIIDAGVDDVVPKFKDLGQVITATNMAAGAMISSNFFDNLQWTRYWRATYQSDQTIQVGVCNRDTTLATNWGDYNSSSCPATGSSSWGGIAVTNQYGTLGYSAKFTVKNNSASANTFARLNIQLMGV